MSRWTGLLLSIAFACDSPAADPSPTTPAPADPARSPAAPTAPPHLLWWVGPRPEDILPPDPARDRLRVPELERRFVEDRAWRESTRWGGNAAPRFAVHAIPDTDLFLVILDYDGDPDWDWSGSFACFTAHDDEVVWLGADCDVGAQAVRSVRGLRTPACEDPLIEVFSQTHMGNGDYHLFVARGHRLELLVETYAVDMNDEDEVVLEHGALVAEYRDREVVLTGVARILAEGTDRVLGTLPVRKVFIWERGRLYEDRSEWSVPPLRGRWQE